MTRSRLLAGRVAVVTGVTSGIGRATTLRLLAAGAHVIGCARDAERLGQVAQVLPGLVAVPADVRDAEQRAALVQTALDRFGRVDVLVNNAGVGQVGSVVEATADDVERVVSTNVTAYVDLTRRVLPGMLERGDGDVLMLSSVAAWVPTPPLTVYAATKCATEGFVTGLRREVADRGVRVHSVCPGFTATEFAARAGGARPREGDPGVRLSPGIRADAVARLVRVELERGRGRTIAAPRHAGVARLAQHPPFGRIVDAVTARLSDRLAGAGRELARHDSGSREG